MAYMTADGVGPLANKAGEWVSNHSKGADALRGLHESQAEANLRQGMWLQLVRFGEPKSGPGMHSIAQLKDMGIVGCYWREDRPLREGDTECPTPPELLEPIEAPPGEVAK